MSKLLLSLFLCIIVIMATGCVSIATGDGGSLKLSKDGVKIKSADGEDIAIDIDRNEGAISFSGTDAEGKAIDHNVSLKNDIPEGFPKEIPIPEGAEIQMSSVTDTESGKMYMVNYKIEGKVIDYYNLYREYMDQAGYTEVTDSGQGKADQDTKIENISAKMTENSNLIIGIMVNGTGKFDDGSISVNIMYTN